MKRNVYHQGQEGPRGTALSFLASLATPAGRYGISVGSVPVPLFQISLPHDMVCFGIAWLALARMRELNYEASKARPIYLTGSWYPKWDIWCSNHAERPSPI
jgi:hypothetical protein